MRVPAATREFLAERNPEALELPLWVREAVLAAEPDLREHVFQGGEGIGPSRARARRHAKSLRARPTTDSPSPGDTSSTMPWPSASSGAERPLQHPAKPPWSFAAWRPDRPSGAGPTCGGGFSVGRGSA